jgi:hypothetical protein
MNERIRQLSEQAANEYLLEMEPVTDTLSTAKRDELAQKAKQAGIGIIPHGFSEKFAQLIVRECCLALWTEECHTSDLAFDEVKRNATRIKEHFGIDPNEITEDMLARSIKWMEQQLEDKKHFGVEE